MLRLWFVLVLTAVSSAAPVPKADAVKPDRFGERRILLMRSSAVQKEIGLNAEQRIAVIDLFEAVDDAYGSEISNLYPPSSTFEFSPESAEKKRLFAVAYGVRRDEKLRTALAEILTPIQFARVEQLERRYLGPFAFRDAGVVARLKFTPEQISAMGKAVGEFRKEYEAGYGPRVKPSGRRLHDALQPTTVTILKLLTVEQAKVWDELIGPTPKLATTALPAAGQVIASEAERAFEPPTEK